MSNSLVLLNGASPGSTLRLDPNVPALTIGRHTSRDLYLDDDRASRLHARISFRANRWCLEDCGSLNGTFVNSQRVQQTILEPGDLIRIGERMILFAGDERDSSDEHAEWPQPRPTALMRLDGDARRELVEHSLSASMSRAIRDSAVLCRMANLLQQHADAESLPGVAIDALVDGIAPDSISLWLVGADGRLRCACSRGESSDEHLLASVAVERNKAILLEKPNDAASVLDTAVSVGTSIGVPIPGEPTCRGAIECHRSPEQGGLRQSDLDFAVVVAHQLGSSLENLEHRERLEQANEQLRRQLSSQTKLEGSSPRMKEVLEQMARVASTSTTVLILGESGTGKELAARLIHDTSPFAAGPFVAVNCAAFTESLLESELFGHEVGAFTGADHRYIGQFEQAHRGTIFLDEIGEMSPSCQAKLLRILEGHPFQRLGGKESIRVAVRTLAATHQDLPDSIKQGRFREDLYYRLRVVDIHLPPLRQRGDDVIELASSFLEHFRRQTGLGPRQFSAEAIAAIREHDWPGNVRELKNAVERAVVLGSSDQVTPEDLGLATPSWADLPRPKLASLREAERRHIEYVLRHVQGNKTQACTILGIGRGTLYRKLEEYGIADREA